MNQRPALTASAFDSMAGTRPGRTPIIWTLPAIGARIGVGADFVRDTLAKQPGTPIRQVGGKWYCFEDDLIAFMRSGPREPR